MPFMIDYLLVVLLFASLPLGIILTFVGCFYCFLLIQHCATYREDETEAREEDRQEMVCPTLTVVTELSLDGIGRGRGRERNAYSVSPAIGSVRRGKRLEVDFHQRGGGHSQEENQENQVPSASTPPITDDQPPPPYHTICFSNKSEDTNSEVNFKDESDEGSPTICVSTV